MYSHATACNIMQRRPMISPWVVLLDNVIGLNYRIEVT